jgi:type IV pilus assembly protein PilX
MQLDSNGKRGFISGPGRVTGIAADERGGAIVLTMIMLVLLTFLGMGSTMISMIEIRSAANDKRIKQGFYLAESAAMEAAHRIENASAEALRSGSISWICTRPEMIADIGAPGWSGSASSCSSLDKRARYAAVYQGIATGHSLGMGETKLHSYVVFGRFGGPNGRCLVEAGYRRRF